MERGHKESCQFECKLATELEVAGARRIGRFLRQDHENYSEDPTRKNSKILAWMFSGVGLLRITRNCILLRRGFSSPLDGSDHGQGNVNSQPTVQFVPGDDLSSVQGDGASCNCQAESHSSRIAFARFIQTIERAEQIFETIIGNARAVITNLDLRYQIVRSRADR